MLLQMNILCVFIPGTDKWCKGRKVKQSRYRPGVAQRVAAS